MTTFLATWHEPGEVAVNQALSAHRAGANLKESLEAGLSACELDPNFLAIGLGSLPNSDGEIELDAAMMDGRDLSAGAICGLRGIVPAISVAKKVLEETPHVMLAGEQARRFAINKGFKPRNLVTPVIAERFETWLVEGAGNEYVHSVERDGHGDTVTMLALETGEGNPHTVAASATSGLAWKLPGRVGDSPIVGAGIYADDEVGCAGATGYGEELWKACASFSTVEAMRNGLSPQAACEKTIRQMMRRQPGALVIPCVVLALGLDGTYGAATSMGQFHLWICVDGVITEQVYEALSPN